MLLFSLLDAMVKMVRNLLLLATLTSMLAGGSNVLHTPTFLYKPMLQGAPTFQYAPTFYQTPTFLHAPANMDYSHKWRPVQMLLRENSDTLPCPSEGFFRHPTNCTKFYRCVDKLGNGRFFIRFMFECPANHVFSPGLSICVIDSCDGDAETTGAPVQPPTDAPVQPPTDAPVQPPTDAPVQPPTDAPVQPPTDAPVQPPTDAPIEPPTDDPVQPITDDPVQPITDDPVQSTTDSTTPEVTETDFPGSEETLTTPSTSTNNTDTQACTPKYVQHHTYCNVYVSCDNSSLRYACPPGSAFDQSRQMCRIDISEKRLCVGKAIFDVHSLRTEIVDGRILLPESLVLPPLDLTQPLHTMAVMTKTNPLVAYPSFSHLFPGAGLLARPQVHLSYPSRRRNP